MTKTVMLELDEIRYLRHWHNEQVTFQSQMGREEQAEWHRARLLNLDSPDEPPAERVIEFPAGTCMMTNRPACAEWPYCECGRTAGVVPVNRTGDV